MSAICDACSDEYGNVEGIPGALYPIETNGDDSRRWIERCDECETYESDEDAAEALVIAGKIKGFQRASVPGLDPSYPSPYAVV